MKLKLENLSFAYENYGNTIREKIFDGVNLYVQDKEKILILGECGSGKSTLSSILASLTPAYNQGKLEGEISYDGKGIESAHEMMSFLSLVPQDPGAYIITTSCEDELAYPLESLAVSRDEMKRRIDLSLSAWGLERYRTVMPAGLSGGEKKRLAIACALISDPEFVIFDESFDDLDVFWKEKLGNVIRDGDFTGIVTSARFIPSFHGLFDAVYRIEDRKLVRISEDDAFENFSFSIPCLDVKETCTLEALNIKIEKERENTLFTLSVPSFHLKRGEIVSLCGDNGSGKSTFSRMLCALESQSEGSILMNGALADRKTLQRQVGYVFQNPDYQIFLPSVRDELSYSFSFLYVSKAEKEKRLEELSMLFSLDLDASASLMSYGERKRLQCAIYYSLGRSFYILDEIEASLPYSESARMVELLASRGAGILLISHDEDFVRCAAVRNYMIESGVMHEI